ncbi:Orotate phosphoribosyltransferase, partial [Frankliniella fusca]
SLHLYYQRCVVILTVIILLDCIVSNNCENCNGKVRSSSGGSVLHAVNNIKFFSLEVQFFLSFSIVSKLNYQSFVSSSQISFSSHTVLCFELSLQLSSDIIS